MSNQTSRIPPRLNSQTYPQLDMPYDRPTLMNINYTDSNDFVHFVWDSALFPNPDNYDVVIESMDVSNNDARYRTIGRLARRVLLPRVIFASNARVGVLPRSADLNLPGFWNTLSRGGTYLLPHATHLAATNYVMQRQGPASSYMNYDR